MGAPREGISQERRGRGRGGAQIRVARLVLLRPLVGTRIDREVRLGLDRRLGHGDARSAGGAARSTRGAGNTRRKSANATDSTSEVTTEIRTVRAADPVASRAAV